MKKWTVTYETIKYYTKADGEHSVTTPNRTVVFDIYAPCFNQAWKKAQNYAKASNMSLVDVQFVLE